MWHSVGFGARPPLFGANLFPHDDIIALVWRVIDTKKSFLNVFSLSQKTPSEAVSRLVTKRASEALSRWLMAKLCACDADSELLMRRTPQIKWQAVILQAPMWRGMYFSMSWGPLCGWVCYLYIANSVISTSWNDNWNKNHSLFWPFCIWEIKPHFAKWPWGMLLCLAFNVIAWETSVILYLLSVDVNLFQFLMVTELPSYLKCRILIGWYFKLHNALLFSIFCLTSTFNETKGPRDLGHPDWWKI